MKRNLIVAGSLAALLLLALFFWTRRGANTSTSEVFEATNSQAVVPAASTRENAASPQSSAQPQKDEMPAGIPEAELERIRREKAYVERLHNQDHNVSIAFYGLVVDQDTNPLPNVTADLAAVEELLQPFPNDPTHRMTRLQRKTGADGRFEVTGLRGTSVEVHSLTKDGYEQNSPGQEGYAAQSGSYTDPIVLRMWGTNIHEQLISGDSMFKIIPDGRHYGIDLAKGAIVEGEDGDLIVWIKRPESVGPSEKFAWSCELAVPGGGLEPESDRRSPMYRAPIGEYTNVFAFAVEYNTRARDGMSLDNRFYVKLRSDQYGRLSADFWTIYHNWPAYSKDPAFGQIHLSYAINPSGSRLLR